MRIMPLVALLVFALPAAAQEAPPAARPQKEEKICRRVDAPTGSKMGAKRICRTKADWAQIEAQKPSDTGLQQVPPFVRN